MADTQQVMYASCKLTNSSTAITEKGIMISVSTTGTPLAYKAADAANRRVVGLNLDTALASGTDFVAYSGIFLFDNSAVYPVTQCYIGAKCYVEDEHTVSISAGSNTVYAGTVVDVVSAGVWVQIGSTVTL